MMKFCPECGARVEEHHKFCPDCGNKITRKPEGYRDQSGEANPNEQKVIICPNCGEENLNEAAVCSSCGYKLVKGKIDASQKKQTERSRTGKRTSGEKEQAVSSPGNTDNKLDKTKIIYVAIGLVAILMLVLYTSGVFETPTGVTQSVPQDLSPGVNLNNMQRINELETQIKNNPGNMQLLLELAHLKNDSGLYEKAIIDYKKYLETNPKDADARIDMGVCYYNLKQYDQAIAQMKQALEYNPTHQIGHLNLGIVNLASGKIEESKEWLNKAVSIDPNSEIGKKAQELLQSH